MNIHPLWYLCLIVRIAIICLLCFLSKSGIAKKNKLVKHLLVAILFLFGAGFVYNGIFGSNNEKQIAKVFWHETRFVHGALYLLASYYFYKNNNNMTTLVLVSDVLFSVMYRIYTNQ